MSLLLSPAPPVTLRSADPAGDALDQAKEGRMPGMAGALTAAQSMAGLTTGTSADDK